MACAVVCDQPTSRILSTPSLGPYCIFEMPPNPSPCAALAAAGSSPASLLLTSMLLRGVVLTSLLLRLSETLSAAWAAVEDGASLVVRNCGRSVHVTCHAAAESPDVTSRTAHPSSAGEAR